MLQKSNVNYSDHGTMCLKKAIWLKVSLFHKESQSLYLAWKLGAGEGGVLEAPQKSELLKSLKSWHIFFFTGAFIESSQNEKKSRFQHL